MHVQDLTEYEPIITFRGRKVWLMTSFKVNLVHSHRPAVLLHLSLYMRVSRHRYTPGGQLVVNLHLQPWMCQRIHSIWSQQSLATNSHWGLLSLPITLKCYSPFEGILDLHNISSFTQTPIILTMIFIDLYCANINPGKEIFIWALHWLSKILKSYYILQFKKFYKQLLINPQSLINFTDRT